VRREPTLSHCVASERAAKKSTTAANTHWATLKRLRRVSAKNLSVDPCVTARSRFGREGRECVEAPCPAELTSAAIAGEQVVERGGKSSAVAGLHQYSGFVVLNDVAESAGVEGDHRRLAKKGFDGDEAESFLY